MKLGVIAVLVATAAAACGDSTGEGSPSNPEGGADGPGGDGDPDAAAGDGPIPIDPGGDGGGPGLLEGKCPSLVMPPAATVYVDANGTAAEAGTMAAPYRTLAKAFANAPAKGVIWITAGTYKENVAIPDKGLAVYGGFAAGFASRTDACATIIEAANASQAVLSAPPEVKSFLLDGLTVQKGARGLSVGGDESVQATFTIANAVFAENGQTTVEGGGASFDRVNVKVTRSVFRDNRAAKGAAFGGYGNVAVTIEGSLFENNIGYSDHGGGVYLSTKTATIVRNTFRGNEIGRGLNYGWGGAIIVFRGGPSDPVSADFAYNVFTNNLAGIGAAVFVDDGATVTMSHDLIYRNRSKLENGIARGSAIYVDGLGGPTEGSRLVADHLTVAFNTLDEAGGPAAQPRGGGVFVEQYAKVTFTNSIFWKNGPEALWSDGTGSIAVSNSIAPGSCAGGGPCTIGAGIFEPPDVSFVDEATNDFHEQSMAGHFSKGTWVNDNVTSPAVDKSDPAAPVGAEPAPNGGRANLGSYGGTSEASKSP
jgi:Right handed beta helix region/Protein of unknown function (DUF1565)